jgi:hypothetical protein
MVLEAFVGPRPEGMQACHFPDRSTRNNRLENLRWDTGSENTIDKIRHGTIACGERNGFSILTAQDVLEIREKLKHGGKNRTLGREYGVSGTHIKRIGLRLVWNHV